MSGKGSYETFDSGAGPTIADKGDYAKEDGGTVKNDVVQGAVPEVPQKG